ncbi:hypothetical protein ABZ695_26520 [Streptomyces sp. NPDC006976]|uniref:hypothetical protein n=1 Tax=Streptomyces sp. NPDC006976 TaxID=3154311 RepID=UPI00340949C5
MERIIDLDRAAAKITERRHGWETVGLTVGSVTWRDETASWPQPLQTDRSLVIEPDSIGVRITNAAGIEAHITLYRGGWADLDTLTGDNVVCDAPQVTSADAFGTLLDVHVARFLS